MKPKKFWDLNVKLRNYERRNRMKAIFGYLSIYYFGFPRKKVRLLKNPGECMRRQEDKRFIFIRKKLRFWEIQRTVF